ncbi:MAG TPA: phosphate signaling complex protein PhoU [Leucothrix mucor]|nr:phosphate signaling complex protein PhoU [Leucothrix mucor]
MELGQHISQRYNEELEEIRSNVLRMGGLVEKQTTNAINALLNRDADLARKVIESDDAINQLEIEIDEECTRVIAKRQPAASDLRLVIAVVKVITDLERIGDEAEKIGRYSKKLAKKKTVNDIHSELSHLGEIVTQVLQDSLNAFARLNANDAMRILGTEKAVNREFDTISRLLITHMMEDPRNIKSVLRVTWCARSLERIAEHSQNIAEYVIYLVKGKDVRHSNLSEIREKYFPHDNDEEESLDR